jgi:hypothetical protein
MYCERPLADVSADVNAYAARSSAHGLGMQGIFLDETVNTYSPEVKRYLAGIDTTVKRTDGLGGNRTVRRQSYPS